MNKRNENWDVFFFLGWGVGTCGLYITVVY